MFNTRKIGTKHRIRLTKSKDGFGIKIAERDHTLGPNRPIYITAITTIGSAIKDGRLKEGDMLLQANGVDLTGKSMTEVTKMLKSVSVNESVEFVVSRQHELSTDELPTSQMKKTFEFESKLANDNERSLIDLDVPDQSDSVLEEIKNQQMNRRIDSHSSTVRRDGPGTYVYDIPLNGTKSAGLGLSLKYPTLDGKDFGIWIKNVITGGAAFKDGRLQPYDQILAVNGINLTGLSNAEASEALTSAVSRGIGREASSNTIRLNIHRRDSTSIAEILQESTNDVRSYRNSDKVNSRYDTNVDNNSHSGSHSSNSHNDSAMSPQTQASNSLRFSSSAISQNTDYTNLPTITSEISTLPKKTSQTDSENLAPSVQSWDDDENDDVTGEERFQRDGFGRQSISEKRHARMVAENTDTYKRNQKVKEAEELERQREVDDKLTVRPELEVKANEVDDLRTWDARYSLQNEFPTKIQYDQPQDFGYEQRIHESLRVSRSRKINDSFRAAVDRSYGHNIEEYSIMPDRPPDDRRPKSMISARIPSSIANSTTSTTNDERYLINRTQENGVPGHKKTSLLTRFLKFGSMKKDKKKNKNISNDIKQSDDKPSIESTTRSHTTNDSHSRMLPANMHQNQMLPDPRYQHDFEVPKSQMNGHNYGYHSLHRSRASMSAYQYPNSQQSVNVSSQAHATVPKLNLNAIPRQQEMVNNYPKYPHASLHQQIPQHHLIAGGQHPRVMMQTHRTPVQTATHTQVIHNPDIDMHNGVYDQSITQAWHQPQVHSHSGLWVANTPACEVPMVPVNGIYGSASHHRHIVNQIPQHMPMGHTTTPFMPPMNRPNAANLIHPTHTVMNNHIQASMMHQIHQPTQIYYDY